MPVRCSDLWRAAGSVRLAGLQPGGRMGGRHHRLRDPGLHEPFLRRRPSQQRHVHRGRAAAAAGRRARAAAPPRRRHAAPRPGSGGISAPRPRRGGGARAAIEWGGQRRSAVRTAFVSCCPLTLCPSCRPLTLCPSCRPLTLCPSC